MTIFLRALWGPFQETLTARDKLRQATFGVSEIDWHFFGMREDNTMGRWTLRYKVKERTFVVVNYPMQHKPPLPDLVDTYVPGRPMIRGKTYVDILRQRLSAADLARASAASILTRR